MRIYILRPVPSSSLWEPWYDKAFGFVIAAETEEAARAMAQAGGGDETRDNQSAWTDSAHSTCMELLAPFDARIIMKDVWNA